MSSNLVALADSMRHASIKYDKSAILGGGGGGHLANYRHFVLANELLAA